MRQIAGVFKGAVGDNHVPYTLLVQMPGSQFDGFSGAYQQRCLLLEVGENLFCKGDGGKSDGDRA